MDARNPTDPVEQPRKVSRWRELYSKLDVLEKEFLKVALRTGDYQAAAEEAQHRNAFDMLSRTHVKEVLLAAAPFCAPDITAALVKPYILQNLLNEALGGDVPASKVLLELGAKGPKRKTVNYGPRLPGGNGSRKNHPGNIGAEDDAGQS